MPLLLFIAVCLSFIFLLSELSLTFFRHSSRASAVKRKDKGSVIFIWVIITISLTAGFRLAGDSDRHLVNFMVALSGLVIALAGLAIRWTAIIQLDKAFTVDVAINKDHVLKTDGIYRIVRHPSYSGLLLFMAGEALAMNTIASFIAVFIPVGIAILYRIHIEEKLLEERFGDEYRDYKKTRRRLIPFLY